jgi:CelD/BcsL family acetyltransferase involved in cellulose biosynthesis
MYTELVDTDAKFNALERDWRELLDASDADCAFLTWEWLSTWWRHFGADRQLSIIVVRQEQVPIAIAPVSLGPRRWRQCGVQVAELLGSGDVGSDYLDLIVRRGSNSEAREALVEAFERRRVTVAARRLPASRSVVAWLANGLTTRGWRHAVLGRDVCPWIDLRGKDWDGYLATLGSEHRYNVRRRIRNLEKKATVSFETATTDADRRTALDALIRLHNRRWETRGGSTAFHSESLRAFHHDVTARFLERGWLRLHVLRVNDDIAAVLYGFLYKNRFYFYQAGFDERLSSQSVGLVMMARAIARAIEEGAEQYDMLHGDEPYKFLWAHETRPLMSVELYPPTLGGWLSRVGATGRLTAKRVLKPRMVPASMPTSPGVTSDRPGLAV